MLGSNAAALYQDAMEHPEKYDEQTVGLLNELVQGAKKPADLEEAETRLLDRATLDFASYTKPPVPKRQTSSMTKSAEIALSDDEEVPFEEGDSIENTQAYWWL